MTTHEPKAAVVLVVDDDDDLRKAIVRDFTRRGYRVLAAASGRQALAIVKSQPVDVVLSDVRMPDGDGIELLNNIKNLNTTTPVLMFITGNTEMSVEQAYDWGADAVLAKPFDRAALFKAVATAVLSPNERWRRGAPQVEADFAVTLEFPGRLSAIETRSISIARGGMFVAMGAPFPRVDTQVSFTILFEQSPPASLSGTGIVRWLRAVSSPDHQTGCGIEFVDLDDACREYIVEMLDAIRPRAFIPRC